MRIAARLILYMALMISAASICPPDSQVDVVFVVDSDGKTGETNYHCFYDFIGEVLEDFPIGGNQIRVGLVTLDTNPHTIIAPTGNRQYLVQQLRQIEYRHNFVNAITCLLQASTIFNMAEPREHKVKTVVVFETDGTANKREATIRMSKILQKKGIHVFVLGIKPRIDHDEMLGVASRPEYYFEAPTYSDYKDFVHVLSDYVCNAERFYEMK